MHVRETLDRLPKMPPDKDAYEDPKIFFIEEQIITVDKHLPFFHGEALTRFQLQFTRDIRGKNISLMQPKRVILNTQIAGGLIKRRDWVECVENYLEHI
jgi:hypothetical protein